MKTGVISIMPGGKRREKNGAIIHGNPNVPGSNASASAPPATLKICPSYSEQTILSKLGDNIRKYRKAKGWSQEEPAYQADLDRTYIGSMERGERNVAVLNLPSKKSPHFP